MYNEGENVRALYHSLMAEHTSFQSVSFVYDLDEDTTLPVIADLRKSDQRLRALKNEFGRGVVNALRFAFSRVEPGPVAVVMGDNSDKLSILPEMLSLWRSGATIVSPSRYMKGGVQHGGGVLKKTLSRTAGTSLRLLGFPTADPTNNFKLYDGVWLREQKIESTGGFEIALELCYKAYVQGRRIVELPTEWFDRTMGESRFNMRKWIPLYLRWYFRCLGAIFRQRMSGSNTSG